MYSTSRPAAHFQSADETTSLLPNEVCCLTEVDERQGGADVRRMRWLEREKNLDHLPLAVNVVANDWNCIRHWFPRGDFVKHGS